MSPLMLVPDISRTSAADKASPSKRSFRRRKGSLRRLFSGMHRWTGLTIGWLIVLAAITGILLAFRPQIEPRVSPHFRTAACSKPLPADDLMARARAAKPELEAQYIRMFGAHDMAARVRFKGNDTLFLDPCTGTILGEQNRYSGLFGWVEKIHTLHFGKAGTIVAGTNALIFAFLLISIGLYLLIPVLRMGWARAMKLDWRLDGRARHMNLHRTVALYAAPVLFLIAITGPPQAFEWVEKAIYAASGSEMLEVPDAPLATGSTIPMERVMQKARALAPQAREILMHVPHRGKAFEVYLIAANAPHSYARTYLFVDPSDGKTLSYIPYAESSLGAKIYYWTMALHTGEAGGVLWRLILLLAALTVPLLAYTGLKSYLGGVAQRRARVVARVPETPTLAAIVVAVHQETDQVKQFDLAAADGSEFPLPTPGAHVDVHLGQGMIRQYSLINGPSERSIYRIGVRKSPASRGGSQMLHDDVKPGDLLTISAPRNHFPLVQGASHHVLIAGGIGITPLLSMARHLLDGGSSFILEYFTRDPDRTPFRNILETPEFEGKVRFHHGVPLDELQAYVAKLLPSHPEGAHAYVCGGSSFIAGVETSLAPNWPMGNIHHEHFAADPSLWNGPRREFELTLARSNHSLTVPADRSIAQALAENGFPSATSCEQGVCGTCLTRVLAGTPEHRDAFLSAQQKAEGKLMMICVSRAHGHHLTLDL